MQGWERAKLSGSGGILRKGCPRYVRDLHALCTRWVVPGQGGFVAKRECVFLFLADELGWTARRC